MNYNSSSYFFHMDALFSPTCAHSSLLNGSSIPSCLLQDIRISVPPTMHLENEAAGDQSNMVYQCRRSLRASVTYTIISADTSSLTYRN